MLPAGTGQDAAPNDAPLEDINHLPQRRVGGRPAYLDAAKRISTIFNMSAFSLDGWLSSLEEPPLSSSVALELDEDNEDERFMLPGSFPVRRPAEPHPVSPRAVRQSPIDEPFEEPMRRAPIDEPFGKPVRRTQLDEPFDESGSSPIVRPEEPPPPTSRAGRQAPIDEPFEKPARRTAVDEPFEESDSEEGFDREFLRRSPRDVDKHAASTQRIKTKASVPDRDRRVPGSERTMGRRSPSLPRAAGPPLPADPPLNATPDSRYSTERAQKLPFSNQRKPEPFPPTSPSFQLEQGYADPNAPQANAPTSPLSISTSPKISKPSRPFRFQSPLDSLAGQATEWIESTRSPDGSGPESPTTALSRSNGRRRRKDDPSRISESSEWSYQRENDPHLLEETGLVYYRLYSPSGTLFSTNPIYENDISLSCFSVEAVQPPQSARSYIAYISQREGIKPSGIKMYLTLPGTSPELVYNLDMLGGPKYCGRSRQRPFLIFVEPNNELWGRVYPTPSRLTSLPYRDLANELPRAYYRLYGTAPSSSGSQGPMASCYPLSESDLSLSTLPVDYVPPPHRAQDYIAYIAERERIHPSRITLYLSANVKGAPGGVSMAAEAQAIENPEEIVPVEMATSTSERYPIMVNVQLEVGEDGALRFETKSTPLRLTMKAKVKKFAVAFSK